MSVHKELLFTFFTLLFFAPLCKTLVELIVTIKLIQMSICYMKEVKMLLSILSITESPKKFNCVVMSVYGNFLQRLPRMRSLYSEGKTRRSSIKAHLKDSFFSILVTC